MTFIASTVVKRNHALIGDLLLTSNELGDNIRVPTLFDDANNYISYKDNFSATALKQKLYVINNNLAIAFANTMTDAKKFLEDLTIRAKGFKNFPDLVIYINGYDFEEYELDFVLLHYDSTTNEINKFSYGNINDIETCIYGQITTLGSGGESFTEYANKAANNKIDTGNALEDSIRYNILAIGQLLVGEMLGDGLLQRWGAGFEIIYHDGNNFKKLDNTTYVFMWENFRADKTTEQYIDFFNYRYVDVRLCITAGNIGKKAETYVVQPIITEDQESSMQCHTNLEYDRLCFIHLINMATGEKSVNITITQNKHVTLTQAEDETVKVVINTSLTEQFRNMAYKALDKGLKENGYFFN